MDTKHSFDITKYKKFIVPVAINMATVFIIVVIILPQFSILGDTLSQIKTQKEKVSDLNSTLSTIVSAQDLTLDSSLTSSTRAVPTGKDVSLIFSALSKAAAASGTELGEFSLTVGGIFGRAAQIAPGVGSTPSIVVSASVKGGDVKSLIQFSSELQKLLPLSQINRLNVSGDTASFEISFFYKPLDELKISKQQGVAPLSQADLNLLSQLKEWEQ
jgi:hypothetical protein